MKKFKIYYVQGGNYYVTTIEAKDIVEAQYIFNMRDCARDIRKIEAVED